VASSGTRHLQGYIALQNACTRKQLSQRITGAYLEPAKGCPDDNVRYCSKEGDFHERGIKPMSQKRKGEAGAEAAAERWKLAREGKFEELPPEQIKTYESINSQALVPDTDVYLGDDVGEGEDFVLFDNI